MENIAKFSPDTLMSFLNLDDLKDGVEPSLQFIKYKQEIPYKNFSDKKYENLTNKKMLAKITYRLNNVGQRSDDFNQLDNSKTNILFAGCSVTFGDYLPENFTWPHHVYKYFKDLNIDVGPLNVVSFPGASGPKIIYNIFKYFNNYGIPDYLFILMPDIFRHYAPEKDAKSFYPFAKYIDGDEITESLKPFNRIYEFQQFYRILEIISTLLNIKLYTTSWSDSTNRIMSNFNFNTYETVDYNYQQVVSDLDINYLNLYDKDFHIKAGDGIHPGFFSQFTYAQYFINRAKNDIKN